MTKKIELDNEELEFLADVEAWKYVSVKNDKEIVLKLHAAAKEYKMRRSIVVFHLNANLIKKINKLAGQNDVETDTLVETILSKYVHNNT